LGLFVLILKVRVVELAEAREDASVKLEGASVRSVVDGSAVEENNHTTELHPTAMSERSEQKNLGWND